MLYNRQCDFEAIISTVPPMKMCLNQWWLSACMNRWYRPFLLLLLFRSGNKANQFTVAVTI